MSRMECKLYYDIYKLKSVQVSCWDGVTMGSGVGMSVFGPLIIATEKTVFAMP
jgi:enoyl-CoA hydratase/carnithine racemase